MIPSPMNSHRMESAPMTGVMMNGSREMKMTGPRSARAVLLTAIAIANPITMTSGNVTRVKVRVKRNAFQKSIVSSARQLPSRTAARARPGSSTLR